MLLLADIFLTTFHAAVVLFILAGWTIPGWRRLHLLVISLTFLSWFVLGIWYGWGYCFLTDWTWQVRMARGQTDLPDSFIKWMLDVTTGRDWNSQFVDTLTVSLGVVALLVSVYFNLRLRNSKRS